jgi:hypothetical protein
VAGGYGEDAILDTSVCPERVERLHYEFDGWLGDDLLESFPVFIITERALRLFQSGQLSDSRIEEFPRKEDEENDIL